MEIHLAILAVCAAVFVAHFTVHGAFNSSRLSVNRKPLGQGHGPFGAKQAGSET